MFSILSLLSRGDLGVRLESNKLGLRPKVCPAALWTVRNVTCFVTLNQ